MKRAVIYARYSCEKQTEMSIDGQIEVCTNYAKENGYTIINTYIDRAISGKTDKRPSFQDMIADSSNKLFDAVIVYKIDRFARNQYDSVINRKHLKDNGVVVLSASENLTDTPESALLLSVLEGISEWYSADLRAKIQRTIRIKVRDGGLNGNSHYCGGTRTYGYDIVNKEYVINENEASNIRYIYQEVIKGRHLIDIKKELGLVGINIHKTIPNIKYKGALQFQGEIYEDRIPPIVDKDTWNLANEMVKKTEKKSYRPTYHYPLSEKLYCGVCGMMLTGESSVNNQGKQYRYYKSKCNDLKRIKADYIEEKVVKAIIDMLTADNIKYIANQTIMRLEMDADATNIKALESKIKANNETLNQLVEQIIQFGSSKIIGDKIHLLEEENEKLQKEISIAKDIGIKAEDIINFLKGYLDSNNVKELILTKLVKRVDIYPDRYEITCYSSDKPINSSIESDVSPRDYPNELYIFKKVFKIVLKV